MRVVEVLVDDRIHLEIVPDDFEIDREHEDDRPAGRVTIVDLVPDGYGR